MLEWYHLYTVGPTGVNITNKVERGLLEIFEACNTYFSKNEYSEVVVVPTAVSWWNKFVVSYEQEFCIINIFSIRDNTVKQLCVNTLTLVNRTKQEVVLFDIGGNVIQMIYFSPTYDEVEPQINPKVCELVRNLLSSRLSTGHLVDSVGRYTWNPYGTYKYSIELYTGVQKGVGCIMLKSDLFDYNVSIVIRTSPTDEMPTEVSSTVKAVDSVLSNVIADRSDLRLPDTAEVFPYMNTPYEVI